MIPLISYLLKTLLSLGVSSIFFTTSYAQQDQTAILQGVNAGYTSKAG